MAHRDGDQPIPAPASPRSPVPRSRGEVTAVLRAAWRRDAVKDAKIVAVLDFQAQPVISHLPNSGQITAEARPAMNSTRCLLSSESTMTSGFPDRLLPVSISRTVLSKK